MGQSRRQPDGDYRWHLGGNTSPQHRRYFQLDHDDSGYGRFDAQRVAVVLVAIQRLGIRRGNARRRNSSNNFGNMVRGYSDICLIFHTTVRKYYFKRRKHFIDTTNRYGNAYGLLPACSPARALGYDGPWPTIFDGALSPDHYGGIYADYIDHYGFFDPITYPSQNPVQDLLGPLPRPGSWSDWDNVWNKGLYDRVLQEQRPLAIYFTEHTYPLGNCDHSDNRDPQALSNTMDYLSGLPAQSGVANSQGRVDYVFV